MGELGALNIYNPSGRFMLNLSRSIDRLMAHRLQVGGCLCALRVVRVDFLPLLYDALPLVDTHTRAHMHTRNAHTHTSSHTRTQAHTHTHAQAHT